MLSSTLRSLTRLLTALYGTLGLILFFAPEWSSLNFAWKISPFVAMTIGGWCLGNAYIAWKISKVWRWSVVYTTVVYLWTFGILESLVLVVFRDRLILNSPLASFYLITLVINLVFVGVGVFRWLRLRPQISAQGQRVAKWVRISIIFVTLFVGFLALAALTAPNGSPITQGQLLPESLSLFTLRAFGVFYLSLFSAGLTVMRSTGFAPLEMFGQGGLALTVPITIAALIYFRPEDLARRPGGIFYILAYVIIFVAVGAVLLQHRSNKTNV